MNLFCRICGYMHSEPPWGEDDRCPTYDFCPCCGVEAGNEDYEIESIRRFRRSLIENGALWKMPWMKPAYWSLEEQMNNITVEFL